MCPTAFSWLKEEEWFWNDKHAVSTGPVERPFNYLHQVIDHRWWLFFAMGSASFRSFYKPSPSLFHLVNTASSSSLSLLQYILIHRHLKEFFFMQILICYPKSIFWRLFFFLHALLSLQNQNILQLLKAHRNIPCRSWQETVIILSSNCSDCGKVRMLDYMCQHAKITATQWMASWRLDRRWGVYRCKRPPIVDTVYSRATSAFLHLH